MMVETGRGCDKAQKNIDLLYRPNHIGTSAVHLLNPKNDDSNPDVLPTPSKIDDTIQEVPDETIGVILSNPPEYPMNGDREPSPIVIHPVTATAPQKHYTHSDRINQIARGKISINEAPGSSQDSGQHAGPNPLNNKPPSFPTAYGGGPSDDDNDRNE